MKILWLTNIRLPAIDKALGNKKTFEGGGWLTALANKVLENQEYELVVCYPNFTERLEDGRVGGLTFHGINMCSRKINRGIERLEVLVDKMVPIIIKENPDIIHIHGSEFQYHYAMGIAATRCGMGNRVVVSIQGLVGIYAKHSLANVPVYVANKRSLREIIASRGLLAEQRNLEKRGEYEKLLLKRVKYVMGRTTWDYACAKQINKDIVYLHCNETLRECFYSGEWRYAECTPYTIFVSQGSKAIKALHMVIEAVNILQEWYPNIKVYVAGQSIITDDRFMGNSYGYYLNQLLIKNKLKSKFVFLGTLTAEQMKEQLLKANVFVSASSIENSPNSLGEAMLLGTPCISSDVGGVADMMEHRKEGYIYPFDEPYMLAQYIIDVFSNTEYAEYMSANARIKAQQTHDAQSNTFRLFECYQGIFDGSAEETR